VIPKEAEAAVIAPVRAAAAPDTAAPDAAPDTAAPADAAP